MKKLLSLLLALAMLIGLVPAMAEEAIEWKINTTVNLAKASSGTIRKQTGFIEMPGVIDGTEVYALEYAVISSIPGATGVKLPDSLVHLNRSNLSRLDSATEIVLSENLTVIMNDCLCGLKSLENITVPASVSYIEGSLSNNPVMKSVTFEGVCPVIIDGGLKTLVNLPADCVIYVPDDQVEAYKEALSLNPETAAKIRPSGKKAVVKHETAPAGDFEFDAATGTITKYLGSSARVDIPSEINGTPVKAIGDKAFFQSYDVCFVTVPEGVEAIGEYGFGSVFYLTYIALPETLRTVAKNGVRANSNLYAVGWSEGLEEIGDSAFSNNFLLDLKIPESVKKIGEKAFASSRAKKLVLGENVESIGDEAFSGNALETIEFKMKNMPELGANIFAKNTAKASKLTLADGISEEDYQAYVAMMAEQYPACEVIKPELAPSVPALDLEAAAPYIGAWYGVAAYDGIDYYGMDLLGMSVGMNLFDNGTGTLSMDAEVSGGCWYIENGSAMFAPILEEGEAPSVEEAAALTLDENGRMLIDLGGIYLILEKEGAEYAAPAIPEKPWPEFDLDNAKYFIGDWKATTYIVDGEVYEAELIGDMILTLNADGTAAMTEEGEETYELKWYAEYGTAYVGETMSDTAKITFDGIGNIEMDMDGVVVVLAPYVEEEKIEGADELLGEWLDDFGNVLTITDDGNLTLTYESDGYVREFKWDVIDGQAYVTEGIWEGCTITLENGIVTITEDEGVYQIFSVDGDLSAAYGDDDDDDSILAMAQPVGSEGEIYFGAWKLETMAGMNAADFGMEMVLTLNEDGTCEMFDGFEGDMGVWQVENGKAIVMDSELYINAEGKLVMPAEGMEMVFGKADGAAQSALPEELSAYVGEWHMVYCATGGLTGDLRSMGLTGMLTLNEDGTGALTGISDEYGVWGMDEDAVRFGENGTLLTVMEDGFLRFGTEFAGYMVFSLDEDAVWTPAPVQTPDPVVPVAPVQTPAPAVNAPSGNVEYIGVKFVCKTYTTFGQTMDASMLGAEYAVMFHDNNLADFTLAGFTVPSLPYSVTEQGVYAINYYGTMFNCTPTATGFDMDYYGTMNMHFVPAE